MSDISQRSRLPAADRQLTDGRSIDGTVTIGAGFDDGRGHAVAYFGYRNRSPSSSATATIRACALQNTSRGVPRCGGSADGEPGYGGHLRRRGSHVDRRGSRWPGTITVGAQNLYNFAPLNYFQRPDERYIAGAVRRLRIQPGVQAVPGIHVHGRPHAGADRAVGRLRQHADRQLRQPAVVGCSSSRTSAHPDNMIIGFLGNFPLATVPRSTTSTELRGRRRRRSSTPAATPTTRRSSSFSVVTRKAARVFRTFVTRRGAAFSEPGRPVEHLLVRRYFQYGRTNYTQVYKNEFSIARLNARSTPSTSMRSGRGSGRNAGISIVCRSVLDNSDPTCVPYDPFGAAPSAAAVNYLNSSVSSRASRRSRSATSM